MVMILVSQHIAKSLTYIAVADLEIFRGGFRFTKTPAKLEVKTKKKNKKKVFTSFLDYLFPAAVSLPSSTAPKLTH